jgi:hypothetical protein
MGLFARATAPATVPWDTPPPGLTRHRGGLLCGAVA